MIPAQPLLDMKTVQIIRNKHLELLHDNDITFSKTK